MNSMDTMDKIKLAYIKRMCEQYVHYQIHHEPLPQSDKFANVMIPMIRRVVPKMLASHIAGVQPMQSAIIETKWDREFCTFARLDSGEFIYMNHVYKLNRYKDGEYDGFEGKCVSEEEFFEKKLNGTDTEDESMTPASGQIFSLKTRYTK